MTACCPRQRSAVKKIERKQLTRLFLFACLLICHEKCWAQAAVGSFEIALRKAGKNPGELSVQQLVDCVSAPAYPQTTGCSGGTLMNALAYLRTHGLARASDISTQASRDARCRDTNSILDTISIRHILLTISSVWNHKSSIS